MHNEAVVGIIAHRLVNFSSRDYLVLGSNQNTIGEYLDNSMSCPNQLLRSKLKNSEYVSLIKRQVDEWWQKLGISVVTILDRGYPALLRRCYDPPIVLFVKGDVAALERVVTLPHVALVGSRRSEPASDLFAKSLGRELSENNICVVSGLASGIDASAHRGALSGGGEAVPTIAVLGQGVDSIYPAHNEGLAEEIVQAGGVILSEYEPGVPPRPHHFLMRNRIIAGISCAVVVVQAAKKSGSLVTARAALEEGREVFVVPGSVRDERYDGSHELLRQGARILTSAEDIFEALAVKKEDRTTSAKDSLPITIEGKITRVIREKRGAYIHEIKRAMGELSYEELLSKIRELEMTGAVVIQPGDFVTLG
jgi:DNA processing protein